MWIHSEILTLHDKNIQSIDFLLSVLHTGSDIRNPVHGRVKHRIKGIYHPEIRLSSLERLRQSQMTLRMRFDWLEASLMARSYPRVCSEIFLSV